jgi:excisionase family DNA binding protein
VLTVPEAAVRVARDPETVRRWIRSGKLRARKVGTQHFIEEEDLEVLSRDKEALPSPEQWSRFSSGRPQPNWVAGLARSRRGR